MFQPLPQFRHRAKPQPYVVMTHRIAVASVLTLVSVFGSPGCSYQLDSVRSNVGNEVERMAAIASEPAGLVSEGDFVVARAAIRWQKDHDP